MHRSTTFALLVIGSLVSMVATSVLARACTLDGKATAFANGTRAVSSLRLHVPYGRTWAPFSFPGRYRVGAPIRFAEDRAQLRAVLPALALRSPWRWSFGDGTQAMGWTATHRFTHAGVYVLRVGFYYPSWRHYYTFDTLRIEVIR